MTVFLMSLGWIFLAEIGDKSMLLALAFATRYDWKSVLSGVFVATAINHLLVVVLGTYATNFLSMQTINIFAALAFIAFGLWTLKGDKLTEDDLGSKKSTPFLTVAIAFFISEMGDKTQLATLTLAAEYKSWLLVWLGTTVGMVLADAAGIVLGVVMGKRIPENAIKLIAGAIFIGCGMFGIYEYLPQISFKLPIILALSAGLFLLGAFYDTICLKLKNN